MGHVNTVFNQLLAFIPRYRFDCLVEKHQADKYVKIFTTYNQLQVMLYAQATGKDSLRELETSMITSKNKLYHLGIKSVSRSTLADSNARRDYQIYEEIFYELLARCQSFTPKHKFKFENPLYTMDATLIKLVLSLYPWAKYRKTKGAVKMHCLLNHDGYLPEFITVTKGNHHEIDIAKDHLSLLPDSIISIDRGYIDFSFLNSLQKKGVWFVTRAKRNMAFEIVGQQEVKEPGVIFDNSIQLTGELSQKQYPDTLRLITYYDSNKDKLLFFLTNNFTLSAATIAEIYKSRWQVELFFKWIKQNLKIKSFLGTSENAVMTQIWVAMIYYLLLTYLAYQANYRYSLLTLTRVLSEAFLQRISIFDLLSLKMTSIKKLKPDPRDVQLSLFDKI